MSLFRALLLLLCLSQSMSWAAGHPLTEQDIAPWNTDIDPQGHGLPTGHGTAFQGQAVYQQYCQSCHGKGGQAGHADELVGGQCTLSTPDAERTVGSYWPYATTLFDYVRRAMPWGHPGILSNDQLYAVCAWVLWANGIIPPDQILDARTLPKVVMPNADGFREWSAEHPINGGVPAKP